MLEGRYLVRPASKGGQRSPSSDQCLPRKPRSPLPHTGLFPLWHHANSSSVRVCTALKPGSVRVACGMCSYTSDVFPGHVGADAHASQTTPSHLGWLHCSWVTSGARFQHSPLGLCVFWWVFLQDTPPIPLTFVLSVRGRRWQYHTKPSPPTLLIMLTRTGCESVGFCE